MRGVDWMAASADVSDDDDVNGRAPAGPACDRRSLEVTVEVVEGCEEVIESEDEDDGERLRARGR